MVYTAESVWFVRNCFWDSNAWILCGLRSRLDWIMSTEVVETLADKLSRNR